MNERSRTLGPFIGHTTTVSTKIWIYTEAHQKLFIQIYKNGEKIKSAQLNFSEELPAACVEIKELQPNQKYNYKLFIDENENEQLQIDSLLDEDLYFYTMPEELERGYRYDFVVMSCHNPVEAENKGYQNTSWNVWQTLPQIINETTRKANAISECRVLFALLIGDQIYADDVEREVLLEADPKKRIRSYLRIYKQFWDNQAYRKVLCSLPAYLMWDDHDITDGWGSREDAYEGNSTEFSPAWKNLFATAKNVFSFMQANRNPEPLSADGFDFAFRIGRAGFVLADLRSNRNIHNKKLWLDSQFQAVKKWIDANRSNLDVVFFISTVVFAHGAPRVETRILRGWPPNVANFIDRIWEIQNRFSTLRKTITNYVMLVVLGVFFLIAPLIISFILLMLFSVFFYVRPRFFLINYFFANIIPPSFVNYYYTSIGDLRDDLNDSWSSDANKERAEAVLNYFFDLQNDENPKNQVYVCILTGDIHTAGYSNIYSVNPAHKKCPVINHLVASPVGYPPFSWVGEAFYRKYTPGAVPLGTSGSFQAQIAHHYTERNVLICSLRDYPDRNLQIKAKFYVERFPEPQTSVFDLERCSHKENINWQHLNKIV